MEIMEKYFMSLATIYSLMGTLITINTLLALVTIFRKPRSIASIFAWSMFLFFLPGVGFLGYLFLGRGLDRTTTNRFEEENKYNLSILAQRVRENNEKFEPKEMAPHERLLKRYFNNMERTPLCRGNKVNFYLNGEDKFSALFDDIKNAKDNIHVEYYAFFNDKIGTAFRDNLIEKAKEGVEVRVVYDPRSQPLSHRVIH